VNKIDAVNSERADSLTNVLYNFTQNSESMHYKMDNILLVINT